MTHTTFNAIQNQLTLNLKQQRDTLKRQLSLAKEQYVFACENYGNSSEQAGRYDKIACSLQSSIKALEEI